MKKTSFEEAGIREAAKDFGERVKKGARKMRSRLSADIGKCQGEKAKNCAWCSPIDKVIEDALWGSTYTVPKKIKPLRLKRLMQIKKRLDKQELKCKQYWDALSQELQDFFKGKNKIK